MFRRPQLQHFVNIICVDPTPRLLPWRRGPGGTAPETQPSGLALAACLRRPAVAARLRRPSSAGPALDNKFKHMSTLIQCSRAAFSWCAPSHALGQENDAALALPTSLWAIWLHQKFGEVWSVLWKKIGDGFKCVNDCEKNFIFKKCTAFRLVKKDKTFLRFLGHFCPFSQKIYDGLSIPKRYCVLGTLCPKDPSVAGMFQSGT
jgi:hypothetical protein